MSIVKRARIVQATLPPPYNLLELPEGESVSICIKSVEEGYAVREVNTPKGPLRVEGKMLRCYTDIHTPVRGLYYLDILSGKAIASVKALMDTYKKPLLIRFTARGREPDKWYEIEVLSVGC